MSILSKLGYGCIVAVVGLFIVFLGLVILIVCITLMGKVFEAVTKRNASKPKEGEVAIEPAPVPVPLSTPAAQEAGDEGIDPQVIAAIAAAIAAYDGGNKSLVVRSIRRASAWGSASRREQLARF